MIEIVTQQQARQVQHLDFCYVCGEPFTEDDPSTRDHVPPKKIFRAADRNWPLILPTHDRCNSEYSFSDEQAKGLVALLHTSGDGVPPLGTEVSCIVDEKGELCGAAMSGLKLRRIVAKILRACYAGLYRGFLREDQTNRAIILPLPILDPESGGFDPNEDLPLHGVVCKLLKDNRKIGNIDRIEAYNGKFRFHTVWNTTDEGGDYFGVFAIDLYGWHGLANEMVGTPQGCFGTYRLSNTRPPENASVATRLELPYKYSQPRNPFEGA